MPSQQFRNILEHELERLQHIRVCTEHGILSAYMSTRDYRKPLFATPVSLMKRLFGKR